VSEEDRRDEARAGVLERLRRALGRTPEEEVQARRKVTERLANPRPNIVPARGRRDPEGRIALFTEMAEAVQTEVLRVPALEDVPAAVTGFLRRHNLPQKLVMAPEPLLDVANWDSQPLLRIRRGTASAEDTTGLTLAAAGIAETGTVMLVSSPTTPTLLAFLPENSIIVLPSEDVDGAYEESWARLRASLGAPPRSVNLITGPSRTGDIAQRLELGAHGPRRLFVLLVDRLPEEPEDEGDVAAFDGEVGTPD
jgi:L-lactate dehydrogenase complex protein LldG